MQKELECNSKPVQCTNVASLLRFLIAVCLSATFLLFIIGRQQLTPAQETRRSQEAAKTSADAKLIARGKYIVEGLAACSDCHTPRDSNGNPDHTKWLMGAPVFYERAQHVPGWPVSAPRIAGLPPGSDAEIITLLTTSVWRGGQAPRPPMPRFHMTRADAEAVVAYLKSL